MLKVTLVKSIIGSTPANRATVYALGLRKISQSNTFEPTPSVLGMIHKVKHLLKVEEVEGEKVRRRKGSKALGATKPAKAASKEKSAAPAKKETAKKEPVKAAAKAEKKPAAKKATTKKKTEESK